MINIRYCEKCKQAFDIATNFSWCPYCRIYGDDDEYEYEELTKEEEEDLDDE
jgi:hypothetical protein